MRKPVPYKKPEQKKNKTLETININKKKIILFVVSEIVIIALAIVSTAVMSMLFRISPFITATVSAAILAVFSVFIAKYFFANKEENKTYGRNK